VLTDTHCHLDSERFDDDRSEVLSRAWQTGVNRILIPGLDLRSSLRAVKMAESHPNLYAAIGVHPSDSLTWDRQTISALKELAIHPKVVAVGEIGLDYYWEAAPREHQIKVLKEMLELAKELQLPVVLHLREKNDRPEGDCSQDLFEILELWVSHLKKDDSPLAEHPGVLHSFSGTRELVQKAVSMNFMIGVTGPVTFKRAEMRKDIVSHLQLEHILIETDSPFLAPEPMRGKRNEPSFVAFIADKIAEIHSTTREQVAEVTIANSNRLFGWGG
jgi:TatD DNase family protein